MYKLLEVFVVIVKLPGVRNETGFLTLVIENTTVVFADITEAGNAICIVKDVSEQVKLLTAGEFNEHVDVTLGTI